MKGKSVLSGIAFMLAMSSFAQKDQIKALEKAMKNPNPSEINTAIANAEGVMANATDAEKAHFYYLKGNACLDMATKSIDIQKNLAASTAAYLEMMSVEKAVNKNKYTLLAQPYILDLTTKLINAAVQDQDNKKFSEGSKKLYNAYLLDTTKPLNLYFAASFAVNAKEYDKALEYYDKLKKIDYSGEGTIYYAKSVLTEKEDTFATAEDRAVNLKLKTHINPRDEKIPSKRGEIYANIALILVEQGKIDEAKNAFADARKANPDDVSLITYEADLYYNQGDYATYKKIIKEASDKKPNDVDLLYNLGVACMKLNEKEEAIDYFNRVIQMKPDYIVAYINLANFKIDEQSKIFEEMDKLGNSAADNKKYNDLKIKKNKLLEEALPTLQSALKYEPDNLEILKILANIYTTLGMENEYKAVKEKISKLEK